MAELLHAFPALHPRDFRIPVHEGGLTYPELDVLAEWVQRRGAQQRRNAAASRARGGTPAPRARVKHGR